ncbi:MAG: RHS repeat-associated core domain-containing protein, partial [Acidobacteriales bacterium]|nr:RHS repeat-associated core domain-containing protein [Terriglobales bacterium]
GSAGISGKIASTYDPSNNNQLTHIQSTATPIYDRDIAYSHSVVNTSVLAGGYIIDDGLNRYLYDGEGRVCAAQSPALISGGPPQITQYVYDAEGQRVAKRYVSSWTCDLSQPSSGGAIYINGQSGQITELSFDSNGTSTWVHTNIGAGRVLIATYQDDNGGTSPVTGSLHFALSDWLGTKRMQTSYNGTVENQWSSLPFGDGLVSSGPDATEHHFTGKEHDSESGNDYFPARYYSSSMGRWLSPDWSAQVAPVPYAKLENPQSLNLYSYMLNNPLSGFDPDGHTASCGGDDGSSCKVTMTQIAQTVTFHDHDKNGKEVTSTVKVVTTLTTISNSNTGAIVSASASATATNVTSNFSSSQLATIGATVAGIQQAGASMALGSNPNQLLTAITAKESTLGIAAPTNPLQLSCSSGTCASGDTGNNIQGALNVLQSLGKKSDYDPASTYSRYNGVPDLDQRRINVNNFMSIYNGMTQSSWGWSPSMPAAPIPPGLQR